MEGRDGGGGVSEKNEKNGDYIVHAQTSFLRPSLPPFLTMVDARLLRLVPEKGPLDSGRTIAACATKSN